MRSTNQIIGYSCSECKHRETDSVYSTRFLLFGDPLAFTRSLSPFMNSSHLKNSFIYLEGEGIHRLSSCGLIQDTGDVAASVEKLYQANQQCYQSVEDHWVRSTHPLFGRLSWIASDCGIASIWQVLEHFLRGKGLVASRSQLNSAA